MENEKIEKMATSTFENIISKTDSLSSCMNTDDKEPIWDGFVRVYRDNIISNKNFLERVPVQIKGKIVENFSKKSFYNIKIQDLKHYLKEGSTLFLCVEILKDTKDTKIFYKSFLPFNLKKILDKINDENPNQKCKRIYLDEFPTDEYSIIRIFRNILKNREKQKGISIKSNLPTINQVVFDNNFDGFCLEGIDVDLKEEDMFKSFKLDNDIYLYARFNDIYGKRYIPIKYNGIKLEKIIMSITDKSVYCNDKKFYYNFELIEKNDFFEVILGEKIVLTLNKDNNVNQGKIKIDIKGTIQQRITDMKFILELYESDKIMLGDVPLEISIDTISINKDDLKNELIYLERISRLLNILEINDDLNLENLSKQDYFLLEILMKSFLDNELIVLDRTYNIGIELMSISNLNILITIIKQSNGRYKVKNFISDDVNGFEIKDYNGINIPLSKYVILSKDILEKMSNIDYSKLVVDIKSIPLSSKYAYILNLKLLELLNIYDENKNIKRLC